MPIDQWHLYYRHNAFHLSLRYSYVTVQQLVDSEFEWRVDSGANVQGLADDAESVAVLLDSSLMPESMSGRHRYICQFEGNF